MIDFLNKYLKRNRNPTPEKSNELHDIFSKTVNAFYSAIGQKIFRPARALNVAFYEAAMVGLARKILADGQVDNEKIREAYNTLSSHEKFKELISQSTTDASNVSERIDISTAIFMEV